MEKSYKLYLRSHLDYGDAIYHNQRNDVMELIEQVQYKAALIISGGCQGTSCVKLFDEFERESSAERRWAGRMTTFHQI